MSICICMYLFLDYAVCLCRAKVKIPSSIGSSRLYFTGYGKVYTTAKE